MAVTFDKRAQRWAVRVKRFGSVVQLGSYKTEPEAMENDPDGQPDRNKYSREWYEETSKRQLRELPLQYLKEAVK